jgi:hypothetical protein
LGWLYHNSAQLPSHLRAPPAQLHSFASIRQSRGLPAVPGVWAMLVSRPVPHGLGIISLLPRTHLAVMYWRPRFSFRRCLVGPSCHSLMRVCGTAMWDGLVSIVLNKSTRTRRNRSAKSAIVEVYIPESWTAPARVLSSRTYTRSSCPQRPTTF